MTDMLMESQLGIGDRVGPYRLDAVLGRGGMGVVFLAEDERLGRKVAIKVVAPELGEDGQFRARFLREARIAASLDHPHVLPVYEADEHGDQLYIVMRYVDGSDLRGLLLREGSLEPGRAVEVVRQVGSALDAANSAGLVHRDVKPGNILVAVTSEGDHAYLADFGLAKDRKNLDAMSGTASLVGTLDYMAPEQLRGERVDGRTDIYALGCVLYQCLTGQAPYKGTDVAVMLAHLQNPPPSLADHSPALASLDVPLAKSMAKDPMDRFQSCSAFHDAIAVSPPRRRVRTLRPSMMVVAAVALIVATAAILAVTFLSSHKHTDGGRRTDKTTILSSTELGKIAYSSGRKVVLIYSNGTGKEQLPTSGRYDSVSWSPDKTQLVAARGGDIWTIDVDQVGRSARLTSGPARDVAPVWAPSGHAVLFSRQDSRSSAMNLYLVNTTTGRIHQVTHGPGYPPLSFTDPGFSPDGRRIVAEGFHGELTIGQGAVYIMNSDGSHINNITPGVVAVDPSWSPDGRLIAFRRVLKNDWDSLYVCTPTGSQRRKLIGNGYAPAWSSDSLHIAFLRQSGSPPPAQSGIGGGFFMQVDPHLKLWVIDVDGHNAKQIEGHLPFQQYDDPTWSASGS